MYRILAANQEVRERRNQVRHPNYAKPELLATRPSELWSWDFAKLFGPRSALGSCGKTPVVVHSLRLNHRRRKRRSGEWPDMRW